MRFASALLLLSSVSFSQADEHEVLSVEIFQKFKNWMDFHAVSYATSEEQQERLKIWMQNDGT